MCSVVLTSCLHIGRSSRPTHSDIHTKLASYGIIAALARRYFACEIQFTSYALQA